MKVSSDKQTLILKGEAVPPRRAIGGGALALGVSARSLVPYSSSNRGLHGGAAEYVRTQDMSGEVRRPLIDIYA